MWQSVPVQEKIKKKLDDVRRRGFVATSRKFLRDHLYSHRRHVFLERDLSKPFKSFAQKPNLTARMLKGRQELDKFRLHFASSINNIADLFDRGCIASVGFIDDELVGFIWYHTGELYDDFFNYVISVAKDEVFQIAGYIIPKHRGTTLALEGVKYGQEYFRDKGFKKTVCLVDTESIVNMKLHFNLDFEEQGALLHTRKLPFYRWSWVEEYEGRRFEHFKWPQRAAAGVG